MRGGRYMMLWQRNWRSIAEPKHNHYSSDKSWHLGQHLPVAIGVFFGPSSRFLKNKGSRRCQRHVHPSTLGWRGTGSRVEPGGSLHTLVPGTGSDTWKCGGRVGWSGVRFLMMLDVIHPSNFNGRIISKCRLWCLFLKLYFCQCICFYSCQMPKPSHKHRHVRKLWRLTCVKHRDWRKLPVFLAMLQKPARKGFC